MDLTHSVSVITASEDNFVHSKSTDLIKPKDSTENVHQAATKVAGGGEFALVNLYFFMALFSRHKHTYNLLFQA